MSFFLFDRALQVPLISVAKIPTLLLPVMSVQQKNCRLFILFVFHRKTNILYLSPQALIKMKITASNNGVWKDFIYCTDDRCIKIDLFTFW
jgi:hypothetical protein